MRTFFEKQIPEQLFTRILDNNKHYFVLCLLHNVSSSEFFNTINQNDQIELKNIYEKDILPLGKTATFRRNIFLLIALLLGVYSMKTSPRDSIRYWSGMLIYMISGLGVAIGVAAMSVTGILLTGKEDCLNFIQEKNKSIFLEIEELLKNKSTTQQAEFINNCKNIIKDWVVSVRTQIPNTISNNEEILSSNIKDIFSRLDCKIMTALLTDERPSLQQNYRPG